MFGARNTDLRINRFTQKENRKTKSNESFASQVRKYLNEREIVFACIWESVFIQPFFMSRFLFNVIVAAEILFSRSVRKLGAPSISFGLLLCGRCSQRAGKCSLNLFCSPYRNRSTGFIHFQLLCIFARLVYLYK